MVGKLITAWPKVWSEIWSPLARSAVAPPDLFSELIQALAPEPRPPEAPTAPPPEALNDEGELIDPSAIARIDLYEIQTYKYLRERSEYDSAISGEASRQYFRKFLAQADGELSAIRISEKAWDVLDSFGNPALLDRYVGLWRSFIKRYNVRYEIALPFSLSASIPGMFSQMMVEIENLSIKDDALSELFSEFKEALSDLRNQRTPMRIKNCLQRQFVLLEAFASRCPGVTGQSLGAMCDQLDWPHATIREVGKNFMDFVRTIQDLVMPEILMASFGKWR